MNFLLFKAPYFNKSEIERTVDDIRDKYSLLQSVPIDVLGFIEFDLMLEF